MKLAALFQGGLLVLAILASPPPTAAQAATSWVGEAQWMVVGLNLSRQESALVNITAIICCKQALTRFMHLIVYSENDPAGYSEYVGSGFGNHVSVQVLGESLVHEDGRSGFDPWAVGILLDWNVTKAWAGSWIVIAILATESGNFSFSTTASDFDLQHGTIGVVYKYAHDFSAVVDIFAGVSAGVLFNTTAQVTKGIIGDYTPWGPHVEDEHGIGGFSGPDGSDACPRVNTNWLIYGVLIDLCYFGWPLHGSPGTWNFWKTERDVTYGWDNIWLMYVDAKPPFP